MQRKETEGEERGDRRSCRGRRHKVQIETGGAEKRQDVQEEDKESTERKQVIQRGKGGIDKVDRKCRAETGCAERGDSRFRDGSYRYRGQEVK